MKRLILVLAMAIFLMSGSYAWAGNCVVKSTFACREYSCHLEIINLKTGSRTGVTCYKRNGIWYCNSPEGKGVGQLPRAAYKAASFTCERFVDY